MCVCFLIVLIVNIVFLPFSSPCTLMAWLYVRNLFDTNRVQWTNFPSFDYRLRILVPVFVHGIMCTVYVFYIYICMCIYVYSAPSFNLISRICVRMCEESVCVLPLPPLSFALGLSNFFFAINAQCVLDINSLRFMAVQIWDHIVLFNRNGLVVREFFFASCF